jgi:hypothetical protein
MILQEASNPAEGVVPDSIVMQFVDEAFKGDLIEGLGKVPLSTTSRKLSVPQFESLQTTVLYIAASTKWRTQHLYKTTCQHYNNRSPTVK